MVSDVVRWWDRPPQGRPVVEFNQIDALSMVAAGIEEAGVLWELLDQPPGVTDPAWRTFPLRMPGDWLISLLLARQTVDEREAFVLIDLMLIDGPTSP